jgi:hypothetical protein
MSYQLVTVANKRPSEYYYTFDEFFKTSKREVYVLGSGPNEYGGLGSKPRLLFNAIKGGFLKEKYIMFADCFDIVFTSDPDYLFLKYQQFCAPIVISAEKNCFPGTYKKEFDERHKDDSPYKYLNSGMIVGERDAIMAALISMDAPNIPNDYWDGEKMVNPNDQEYWQHEYVKQPVEIVLDTAQILCNTLHDVDASELDFGEERIANKTTKTYPCSFHFNGGAKTGNCRTPILQHLNLL